VNDIVVWVNDHPFVWAIYGCVVLELMYWLVPKLQGQRRYLVTKNQYAIVFSRRLVPRDKVMVITVRRSDEHEPDWVWHTEPDPLCEDEPIVVQAEQVIGNHIVLTTTEALATWVTGELPPRWTVNQYDDHAI
jgi:hypothetical protein